MTSAQRSIAKKRVSGGPPKTRRSVTTVSSYAKAWDAKAATIFSAGNPNDRFSTEWTPFAEAVDKVKLLFQAFALQSATLLDWRAVQAQTDLNGDGTYLLDDKADAADAALVATAREIGRELSLDRGDAPRLRELFENHVRLAFAVPRNNQMEDSLVTDAAEDNFARGDSVAYLTSALLWRARSDENYLALLSDVDTREIRARLPELRNTRRYPALEADTPRVLEAWLDAITAWFANGNAIARELFDNFRGYAVSYEAIDEAFEVYLHLQLTAMIAAFLDDSDILKQANDDIVRHLTNFGEIAARIIVGNLVRSVDAGETTAVFTGSKASTGKVVNFESDRSAAKTKQRHSEKNEVPGPVHGQRDRSRGRSHQYHSEKNEVKGAHGSNDTSRGRGGATHQYQSEHNEKPGPARGQRDRSRGRGTHQYHSEKNEKKGVHGSTDTSRGSAKTTIDTAAAPETVASDARRSEKNEKPGPVRGLRDWRGDRHSSKSRTRVDVFGDGTESSSSSGNDEESGSESLSDLLDPRDVERRERRRARRAAEVREKYKSVF